MNPKNQEIPLYENEYISVFKRPTAEGYLYTVVKARTGLGASIIPMIPATATQPSRFLVISQYRPPMGGIMWEFPAGGVDEGENSKETAIRELLEETNVNVHEDNVHHIGSFHNAPTLAEDFIDLYIAVLPENYDPNQVKVQEGEIIDYQWLTLDELLHKSFNDITYGLNLAMKVIKAKHEGHIVEAISF